MQCVCASAHEMYFCVFFLAAQTYNLGFIFADRLMLLRYSQIPPRYTGKICAFVLHSIPAAILVHFLFAIYVFGERDLPSYTLDGTESGKWHHHGTRLVAVDSLTRQNARWAMTHILGALDDPYLINRQFGARGLEKMTGIDPRDYGYRFYMFKEERVEPLRKLREALLEGGAPEGQPQPAD